MLDKNTGKQTAVDQREENNMFTTTLLGKLRQSPWALTLASLMFAGTLTQADDREIYQSSFSLEDTGRPKVLIIFDDSGSMSTNVTSQRPAYDPTATYQSRYDLNRIYWSTNNNAPGTGTSRWYSASINRCAESYSALANVGFFQGKMRRYREQNSSVYTGANQLVYNAEWRSLSTGDKSATDHLDCEADVLNANPGNGLSQANGYPFASPFIVKPNYAEYREPGTEYDAATTAASNVSWGNEVYTLYTGHYLDYLRDTSLQTTRSRLEIAQDVVTNLIEGNPGIDFGIVNFNQNGSTSSSGGRVTKRINDTDDPALRTAYRNSLVTHVDGINANGWTPLCESTYEAYLYLAGEDIDYASPYPSSRDALAENSARTKYESPANNCAYTYVILMTDGLPTYDTHANSKIKLLLGAAGMDANCGIYADDHGSNSTSENCLPRLAEYMANTDLDGDTTNGDQFGITYTIGFTTDQTLLSDTADLGKGEYYTADSADTLTEAFQGAILSILATSSTFTSPSVAVDSFNRTQSRDDVFYAMFEPAETVNWSGNIKKLKLAINEVTGVARFEDKNGDPATDSRGRILADADSYWSVDDGEQVERGGVGQLLAERDPATRVIKTNTGVSGALENFVATNMDAAAFGFDVSDPNDPTAALHSFFGVPDQTALEAAINFGRGYKVNPNGSLAGNRDWILADMLHSKPVVVNYGTLGAFTDPNEPDQRLVVGTNAGFLHMFGNDNGQEDWAFFPKELAPILKQRQDNAASVDHVYGIDSSPIVFSRDYNGDGTLDASDGDTVYVYFGLRRGGRGLYALNISTPDSPSYMWRIDNTMAGFSELGQTWSNPVVTYIPGYVDGNGLRKPVLMFGAGYDESKDASGLGNADTMGRGLFIVDAVTGALVWSLTPAANSATNLQETGLQHSVPGAVTPLDSNGDELTDRIYFVDTGGNIWRVDMGGNALPTTAQDTWRITKLAAMNGGTDATDRRFFNAPDIVRTTYKGQSVDAILVGSGDRTNPNATDVSNEFYMIRDKQTEPYFTPAPTTGECTGPDPVEDFRCVLPLGPGDLYDVSDNLIQEGDTTEKDTAKAALLASNGWRLPLRFSGEKSLSRSLTIDGKVYFTTFSPDPGLSSICEPSPGTGRLYVVDLLDASAENDGDNNNVFEDVDRSRIIGSLIPDTPSPHFGKDGEIRLLLPGQPPIETGSSLRAPYGSYWYREEY
tara:strand:- start:22427 stop:26056 length:3630 start_codon:yes stop_codon:yes gene_type:complete